jgi:hypothetical protein
LKDQLFSLSGYGWAARLGLFDRSTHNVYPVQAASSVRRKKTLTTEEFVLEARHGFST